MAAKSKGGNLNVVPAEFAEGDGTVAGRAGGGLLALMNYNFSIHGCRSRSGFGDWILARKVSVWQCALGGGLVPYQHYWRFAGGVAVRRTRKRREAAEKGLAFEDERSSEGSS